MDCWDEEECLQVKGRFINKKRKGRICYGQVAGQGRPLKFIAGVILLIIEVLILILKEVFIVSSAIVLAER